MKQIATLLFLLSVSCAKAAAQTGARITRQAAMTRQQCDSLGDAAMHAGDTSAAVLYYEQALEDAPQDKQAHATLEKLRRYYRHAGSSFYLKEY